MASPPPLLHDVYYPIYNRGINRENIFNDAHNYDYFWQLYIQHIEPMTQTFAYCLLKNHFHLLVRIKSKEEIQLQIPNSGPSYPSKKFSDFFNAYAKSMNKAYGRTGSLFQHPFGRVVITNDRQFYAVVAYFHQNPQKHRFVDDFREWKYSSYATMLSEKPTHLPRDTVLDWFDGKEGYLDLHGKPITEGQSKWFAQDDPD